MLEAAVVLLGQRETEASPATQSFPSGAALVAVDTLDLFSHTEPIQRTTRWHKAGDPFLTGYSLRLTYMSEGNLVL